MPLRVFNEGTAFLAEAASVTIQKQKMISLNKGADVMGRSIKSVNLLCDRNRNVVWVMRFGEVCLLVA